MPPLCINLLDWMRQTLKPLGLKEKQLTFIHVCPRITSLESVCFIKIILFLDKIKKIIDNQSQCYRYRLN